MHITSSTRLVAGGPAASLDLVDTATGEILAVIPVSSPHSRGGQYLGLLDVGQHLEAGQDLVAFDPPQRARPILPDNMFDSGANPEYVTTDLQKMVLQQQALVDRMQERQLDFERQLMVREAVLRNHQLEAERLANPPVADPLEASPTEAQVIEPIQS